MSCPLCRSTSISAFAPHLAWGEKRDFLLCDECDLVFVPLEQQVDAQTERARYATHNNDLSPGFLKFLAPTIDLICELLPKGRRLLDFGSGPEPTLSKELRGRGYEVISFDPHFNPIAIEGEFDLILLHEVFEHLRSPRQELEKLKQYLKSGGFLVIRTEQRPRLAQDFSKWWYARDFTHVIFPSVATYQWMASHWGWKLQVVSESLVVFTFQERSTATGRPCCCVAQ